MNIENLKKELLVKFPILQNVILSSNIIVDNNVDSLSTDGKNIYYNLDFINSISEEQRIFAFANVFFHIFFNHTASAEGKDKVLWNIATDAVINSYLRQEGLANIENSINLPEAINYSAEEMYDKLLEEKNKKSTNPRFWTGEMYGKLVEEFSQNLTSKKTK